MKTYSLIRTGTHNVVAQPIGGVTTVLGQHTPGEKVYISRAEQLRAVVMREDYVEIWEQKETDLPAYVICSGRKAMENYLKNVLKTAGTVYNMR